MTRPSEIKIPVGYPNDDPSNGAGMGQRDYDDGQIGSDSLRTIPELLQMETFNRLEPEFQRCFIAMAVAAKVEAGLIHGVGTGWRSEAQQQANYERDPKQFAPVSSSLHMRKKPFNVAYAIDTVPGDTWKWMHANCARFFINALDDILHEQHHIQPIWFPNSGSGYNANPAHYSALAAQRHNLPYLGTLSLAEWLARDEPITINPSDPQEDDDMTPAQDQKLDEAVAGLAEIRGVLLDDTYAQKRTGYPSFFSMLNQTRSAVFPNGVTDAAGNVLANAGTLAKRIAAHLGLKTD